MNRYCCAAFGIIYVLDQSYQPTNISPKYKITNEQDVTRDPTTQDY